MLSKLPIIYLFIYLSSFCSHAIHYIQTVICVDLTFASPIVSMLSKLPTVKAVIVMCGKDQMPPFDMPNVVCYEDLIRCEEESL